MSAGIDQRGKGHSNSVPNGHTKDMNKDGEFDNYLQSQHQPQGYGAAPMPGANDPYYYTNMSFPYVGQAGMNDGAWSTGGDAMFSLGGYDYSGMFGFGYPQFGWAGDYWNATNQAPKDYSDYYRTDGIPTIDAYTTAMNGEMDPGMKAVDQGLKNMTVVDKKLIMEGALPSDMMMGQHMSAADHICMSSMSNSSLPPPPQNAPKKSSWAAIASQPARPQPVMSTRTFPPRINGGNKHNMDIGTWDAMNSGGVGVVKPVRQPPAWSAPRTRSNVSVSYNSNCASSSSNDQSSPSDDLPNGTGGDRNDNDVLDYDIDVTQYNLKDFNLNVKGARFFIIKSYSEDDIHRSIKYNIWCSTEHGNKRLDAAFREREGKGPIYLLSSVNGSGHFCGVAQMLTLVDYGKTSSVWAQDKWKGQFQVKWVYVKDVPNSQLRYIRLENNDNKPVTNSRDTQEVPLEKGKQMLKIIHNYKHTTSIFDDFQHYEKRQEDDCRKVIPQDRRQPRR